MDLEASEQREKVLQGKIQWYADYANDQDKSVTREMARANKAEQREKVLLDLIAVAPHDINCFPIRVMRLTPGAFALQYGDQKVECDCWKAKAALAAAGKGEESDGTR